MKNVSEKSKRITAIITSAVLVLLMASSPFTGFSSSTAPTVNASGVPASISQAGDYGDIMQYDWPLGGRDEGNTGFNSGPAPDRADVLWAVSSMRGSGMVSVFDGKAFVIRSRRLLAFDAFNGSLLYDVDAPGTPSPSSVCGVHKLDDTYLLLEGGSGMVCRKIATGEVVWNVTTPNANRHPGSGTYFSGHYSSSMKMHFNHVYEPVASEARIIAYDLSDPSTEPPVAWNYVADSPSELLCSGDGKVFLGTTEGKVYALNINGTRVWQASTLGGIIQQSAMYYNGNLYTSAVSWQVTCFDGETGERLWQAEKGIRSFSAYRGTAGHGMIFDALVQIDPHGYVAAWDAETGELIWRQSGYYNIAYTTMAAGDGKVYGCTCDQRAGSATAGLVMPGYEFTCFDAFTGTVLWKIRGLTFSTPSIAYGNLYGITGGVLYCIGPPAKDWSMGLVGNVENPRVAVGQSGPADISTPKWAYQTGGDVYSSPAVVDGKLYVGSTDKNWYCLDAYTGAKIWSFPIGHYVRTSAAVAGGKVFTGADDGYFYAIDADTGGELWKTSAGGHFPNLLAAPEAEPRSSPIVINNRLYVGSLDGKVYCLDTADGSVEWTYTTGGPIMGSPAYSDGTIYIASTDGYLYALEAADGDFIWQSSFTLNLEVGIPDYSEHYNIGTPTVAEGTVFIGGGVMYGTAVPGVDYGNQSQPSGAWGGGIRFFAFNATTGASVFNITRAGNTQPSYVPCYFDGQIYAGEYFAITSMNAMDPTSGPYEVPDFGFGARMAGNRTWGQWLGYQIQSSVAYADDITSPKIYVGSDIGSVYCLDPSDGSTFSVFTAGANVPCSPAIWEGKLYVGSVDGNVYCFDDSPTLSTSIYADSDKGAKMWNNETITICGRLVGNPDELVWEMASDTYVPVDSELHPGLPDAEIKLSFTKPDDSDVALTTTADKHGFFNFSYNPTDVGEWGWVVYYDGEQKPRITYEIAYGKWNTVTVTSPTTSNGEPTNGEEPPPEGIPTEYIYAIVAIIAIIIIAVAAYAYMKRGKK
jgi:outer membrane protein assembly factor BamB